MTPEELPESYPDPVREEPAGLSGDPTEEQKPNIFATWYETLAHLGLGESVARVVTTAIFLLLIIAIVWVVRAFYEDTPATGHTLGALAAEQTATGPLSASVLPASALDFALSSSGVRRFANLHTIVPDRPRKEMTYYEVVEGDTIIGIADKFGLEPQTVLWGNYYTLRDDPHNLRPGQKLNILPVDGTYYEWQAGDGLNGVAEFFGVKAEDIISYAPNKLDSATIGDFANPNILAGTWLIVPGGSRPFISWSAPAGVTRENPASASVLGSGACGPVTGGAVGFGSFLWPTNNHYLSGFDFSPATNHYGLDLDGETGDPIYAADSGVIVYSGWNDWGYGNMLIVDHGNDWQTLYAHLSVINAVCGESVGQGQTIGLMGSTGNSTGSHLHFEMHNGSTKVNPWSYLPPP